MEAVASDPDHFGVLVPRPGHEALGVLTVDRDVAALFVELDHPARLSAQRFGGGGGDPLARAASLVLDGVLAIETEDGLVSGPAAHGALFDGADGEITTTHPVSEQSHHALRQAAGLPVSSPSELSSWLYGYGNLPHGPRWSRLVSKPERLEDLLRLPGSDRSADFEQEFERTDWGPWRSWTRRAPGAPLAESLEHASYKLYVSPMPLAMPDALAGLAKTIANAPPLAFKIGATSRGLLRPDKLVVYFDSVGELDRFASGLEERLQGCPAHGVPFTAPASRDGLLSWGVDPPRRDALPGWRSERSWRLGITDRLARSLLSARDLGTGYVPPWRFALDRLSLDGIDVENWLPPGTALEGHHG